MKKSIDAIRVLSIDMIEKAKSGHPGICMGAAPIMYTLFKHHLIIDTNDDKNNIRDRFILSAGHGSAMLYATLYLSGLNIKKEDLMNFRQLNSKTPGHPELTDTKFIDATSGPLGQGVAQGVGMALAEAHNAKKYNVYSEVVDNYTYVVCGDGDLQEGVSAEASSLAGHFGLNKLIILWDSNDIQLDNPTNIAISENIKKRYEAYNFNVIEVLDGENVDEINLAINKAKTSNKPTLIEVKTTIGFGSPNKAGTTDSHGAPLGVEEAKKAKENYGWNLEPFEITNDIFEDYQSEINSRFVQKKKTFEKALEKLEQKEKKLHEEYTQIISGSVDYNIEFDYLDLKEEIATRVASGRAIQKINKQIPNLIGGSADLSKSNNSSIENSGNFAIDQEENKNIPYGVREFAMAAITNGITLYNMNKAFCATFFVFSDYLKPALRMSAIQEIPSVYVLTHDSIAVGEDGPTHEPIEQLTGLRAIPNVNVIRPSDFNETQVAWKEAINSKSTPTVLVLSRQNLVVNATKEMAQNLKYGAYIISDIKEYEKVIIATGSEVDLAIKAQERLLEQGIKTRVVSMPSTNIFDKQSKEYKKMILGDVCKCDRVFVEMSSAEIGYKYANKVMNINTFGKSGKGEDVIEYFGFTVDKLVDCVKGME